MHLSVIDTFETGRLLSRDDTAGRSVLEVGAYDVNGSVRPIIETWAPKSYLGVDREPGPRVDRQVDAVDLIATFGLDAFNVVVTTEMLEHVRDWRRSIANLAGVIRTGGLLILTTRSPGFPYHEHPEDHWRYTSSVMQGILEAAGLDVEECYPDPDPNSPGVFARARKPSGWEIPEEADLLGVEQPSRVESAPLSILGFPHHNPDGSGYYRYYLPYKHLAHGVNHRVMLPEPGTKFSPDDDQVRELDVIVGQRIMGPGAALWDHWAPRVNLVYETDDDILNPDTSSGLSHLIDETVAESIRHCIRVSDMVTVSTEMLAEQMRHYHDTVRVLPNMVHGDMLYLDRPTNERVTVGWAGGMSHLVDWVEPADAIRAALTPEVDLHFVGVDYACVKHPFTRYTPWQTDVWDYYAKIDFDIGLAPLADTPFNRCKSPIKALEYMALGIPVVASDVPAYRDLVVDGVTGYLVSSPDEWRDRLGELINDSEMRIEMGKNGREIAANWTIQRGWKLWKDAYEEVTGWHSVTMMRCVTPHWSGLEFVAAGVILSSDDPLASGDHAQFFEPIPAEQAEPAPAPRKSAAKK